MIPVPGPTTPAGSWFDISAYDPTVNQYYLADRNTAGVDVINTKTLTTTLVAGAGAFTGIKTSSNSGPNGIALVGNGVAFAGDGNSTTKVVSLTSGAVLANFPTVNPVTASTSPAPPCGTPTTGTANQRVDEIAYDPTDNVVIAINDLSCPSFATFYSGTAPYASLGTLAFTNAYVPGQGTGVEAPIYDPTQGLFIIAVPGTTQNPTGAIDLVSPTARTIVKELPVPGCSPNGVALGQSETLFVGCASATNQFLETINAVSGAVINTIQGIGGADEVWYSPYSNRFYCACSNNVTPGPVLAVADGTGKLLSTTASTAGAHSVAVDSSDRVYLPQRGLGITTFTVSGH